VRNGKWVQNPLDAFILSGLEAKRLTPAAPVDRRKLIRRVTFDLHGLPPTPEEVEAFVKDPDPKAYEKLVDRLLASPHYGERWGRHWLDLARYADSEGQEGDGDRSTAYHYRDFVIRSLNEDQSYQTFVRWQIAGDEYEPDNPRAVSATGFLIAGPHASLGDTFLEEERLREHYNDLDDILQATGTTFLGLTIGCARCHDHKYDPIPTRDYYRLAAIFNAGDRAETPLIPRDQVPARRAAEQEWNGRMEAAKKAKDEAAIRELEAHRPPYLPTAYAMADFGGKPRESWLLERGDFRRRKEKVELGFLTALTRDRTVEEYWSQARAQGKRDDTTYQRRALAEWMTDSEHGAGALLARVMVNRLWQGHFGEGLVRTPSDFGKRCDGPTHPELLEWLAYELAHNGWRLKPLHRLMVLSAAYQEGSALDPQAPRVDPENRLLWRRRLTRLEAESYRDSMLAVAVTLNPEMYGPGFRPPIPSEAMQARNIQDPYPKNLRDGPENRRRSVFMFHKRVVQYPLLQAFDGPDASASCSRRSVTTVAPQALAVLNEPFVRLRSMELAHRLRKEAPASPAAQVERAYRLALGRAPTAAESETSVRFIAAQTTAHGRETGQDTGLLALADFAQVVFGLNEFIYID
jgi:hypothetical protein